MDLIGAVTNVAIEKRKDRKVDCHIDHWPIIVNTVPGIEQAVLDIVQTLSGQALKGCHGEECDTNGYREGTRFFHIYGIDPSIPKAVFDLIEEMGKPFETSIQTAKTVIQAQHE